MEIRLNGDQCAGKLEVVLMRLLSLLLAFAAICSLSFAAAQFSPQPYLYGNEKNAVVNYTSFQMANNTTAKIVKINGDEAFLLVNEKPLADAGQIKTVMSQYYNTNFYPSADELAAIKTNADAFNKSRNYVSQFGPAEYQCMTAGTHLDLRPCNDLNTCAITASLVCSLAGEGCLVDVITGPILEYKQSVDKLNGAYAKFSSAYDMFGPETITSSFDKMTAAFDDMKAGADTISKSKLRYTDAASCPDCVAICAPTKFDYAAITSGKTKIAAMRIKTAPYALLDQTASKIQLATTERINYRAGEEKAVIFTPKYTTIKTKYEGLKGQAVEAKLLVSDSDFVSAADAFLAKGDELDKKMDTRDFDSFDALISSYDTAGKGLSAMINNSTAAYRQAFDAQDKAGDRILEAQWSVNRLSKSSIDTYNSLATKKNTLDARFKPPMTASQYDALATDYVKLEGDSKAYLRSAVSLQESVFGAGNAFGRASVDGAMAVASSMVPISFKTRQSFAKFVPPVVLAVIDLSLLSVALLAFVAVFYYFHGFFKSKLAVSGWVLAMLGFMFVLLIGSVGFYSIVLSTERYATFSDFYASMKAGSSAAIIIEESGASAPGVLAMHDCADQIQAQLSSMDKKAYKYYISGTGCTAIVPKTAGNSTNGTIAYETKTMKASECLNAVPDIPIFDLQASGEIQTPVFTTVVTKQAIFKGTDAYYAKKPMCDAANVIN